jgi:hypothetical protein
MSTAERILTEGPITLEDAAKLLGVSVCTVRRHLNRGLEHVRIGPRNARILTSRQAVFRFTDRMTGTSESTADRTSSTRRKELDRAATECAALAP